jgi:YbbR domain-containing protein
VSVGVDPTVATALGPPSFIAEAAAIRTQPVDISGATEDVVLTVSLDLPPDVSVSGGTSVTVTVQIEAAQGRRTLAVTAVAVGLDADLSVSGALPFVEVELLGELPTLRELRPNDIAATVNLSGLDEGTHAVNVSVSAPADTLVADVSPETIEIALEAR